MIQVRERGRGRVRSPFLFGVMPSVGNGGGGADEVVSFGAYFQTSLVPWVALGSDTPTFTRASTAYQTGFDGKLNLVLSHEARFQGARRVANLVRQSQDWSGATWTKRANVTVTANQGSGAYADLNSIVNTVSGGDLTGTYSSALNGQPVGTYGVSVVAASVTGTTTAVIRVSSLEGGTTTSATVNLTTTPTRFFVSGGMNQQHPLIEISPGSANVTILAGRAQIESLIGVTNTNPSEYVSVGVLSAPYHGAGVDGVAYKSTLNGNTVVDNVVVEATGAPITSAAAEAAGGVTAGVVDASGPLGYLSEGSRTNAILQSNTLGTTWTVSNAADMEAVAADAYVSTDGTTTMDKLQPKATTAVHSLDQAFTFTAAKYTFALDLRYVPATPQRWVALILNDGTTTWGASFDLLNGVAGAVSAGATSTIAATALANVYRVSVTNTANAAAAAGTVKISLNATDTATLESAARAGTETLGAGFVQHEIGTFASTYIPTTTTAVTRAASVDQYASAGNISATATSLTMELTPSVALGSTTVFHWASYVDADNYTAVLSDGTNLIARKRIGGSNHDATIAWTRTAGTVAKVGARFDTTNGVDIFLSGTQGTADTTTTASQIGAAFQVGADGNGANQDFCEHRFFKAYPTALSASRMQAMTT